MAYKEEETIKSENKSGNKETEKPDLEKDQPVLEDLDEKAHPGVVDLEESVEPGFKLDTKQLLQFLSRSSPVLEQRDVAPTIASRQPRWIDEAPVAERDEGDQSSYIPLVKKEEAKYMASDAKLTHRAQRIDITQAGRDDPHRTDAHERFQQESFFKGEGHSSGSSNVEKYLASERIDIDQAGRHSPHKPPEIKYDPKLPKH